MSEPRRLWDAGTSRTIRKILLLWITLAGLAVSWTGFRYFSYKMSVLASAKTKLWEDTRRAAQEIDAVPHRVMEEVQAIATGLSNGSIKPDELQTRFKASLMALPHCDGMTVAYRPFGYSVKQRLYGRMARRMTGGWEVIKLEDRYDYSRPENAWFSRTMSQGQSWTGPIYGGATQRRTMIYGARFILPGETGHATGVIALGLPLDSMRGFMEGLRLGQGGFGALVGEDGTYLYHPDPDYIVRPTTLQQVAASELDTDRTLLAQATSAHQTGMIEHRSRSTGLDSWLLYTPIPSTGWSMQNTFLCDDLPLDRLVLRHRAIALLLACLALAVGLSAFLAGFHVGHTRSLWIVSTSTALAFLTGMAVIWQLFLTMEDGAKGKGLRVSERSVLHQVMQSYVRSCEENHTEPPVFVPTGVYLESAQFLNATDLQLTGSLWQKYELGAQDNLVRGFTFSDATKLETLETYREKGATHELVRWNFRAEVRQPVDHLRYPLEVEQIGIRILHKELNHNVVLTPDLPSYRLLNPTSLPGLEKTLRLPGWRVAASWFEFRKLRYDTSFGATSSYSKENLPSLCFRILIRRNVLDAFLSNLTPLFIVATILFILVMLASRDERLVSFLQAGSGRILNICTAMFFVIAFSHIEVRRRISAEEVFYMEYFYFLIYFGILWVCANSVLFARGKASSWILFENNLISKLIYWPFLVGVLFLVTMKKFY